MISKFSSTIPLQAFELKKPETVIITEEENQIFFFFLKESSGMEALLKTTAVSTHFLNYSEIPIPSHPLSQEPAA